MNLTRSKGIKQSTPRIFYWGKREKTHGHFIRYSIVLLKYLIKKHNLKYQIDKITNLKQRTSFYYKC